MHRQWKLRTLNAIKLHVQMYSDGDARQMKKNEISEKWQINKMSFIHNKIKFERKAMKKTNETWMAFHTHGADNTKETFCTSGADTQHKSDLMEDLLYSWQWHYKWDIKGDFLYKWCSKATWRIFDRSFCIRKWCWQHTCKTDFIILFKKKKVQTNRKDNNKTGTRDCFLCITKGQVK